MIKFGDIEYFTLLELRDKLRNRHYNKLELKTLNALRNEVEEKIEQINTEHKNSKQNKIVG